MRLCPRLTSKIATSVGFHQDVYQTSGLRNAWADLRNTELWAVEARAKALNTWKQTTLQLILVFRHEQERIQRRVKDELRTCVGDHAEMLHSTLPRIRRTYERKCEEYESFRQQQRAIDEQRQLLASIESEGHANPAHAATDSYFSLPQAGNTAPISPGPRSQLSLWRKEGWDAAPKRLNALFTRMLDGTQDTGSAENVGDSLHAPSSLKSHQILAAKQARAKREMEESERTYRKAVFDLETLRIRRNKVLNAAAKSVMQWRQGLAHTMQAACAQQARDSIQMCNALQNVHERDETIAEHMLDTFDTEQARCEKALPNAQMLKADVPVQFVNYRYGAYRDLIFGVSLVDYAFSRGDGGTHPPMIMNKCIRFMESPRAINCPGIYRLSAKQSRIQELSSAIERDEDVFQFDPDTEEPVAVASILKLYFRQLPEPIMSMPWEERIRYTHAREENIRTGFPILKARIRRLPQIHQVTLRALLMHLANVAAHSANNKMDTANLAVVFSPVILSESNSEVMSIAAASEEDRTMEDLITYWPELFGVGTGRQSPLPPVPTGQGQEEPEVPAAPASAPLNHSDIDYTLPRTPLSATMEPARHNVFMQTSRSLDGSPSSKCLNDDMAGTVESLASVAIRARTPET